MATFVRNQNGTIRARIRIRGIRPESKTFHSMKEARIWARETEKDLQAGILPDEVAQESKKRTVADAIERYLREEVQKMSPSSIPGRKRELKWFKKEIGHLFLDKLSPAVIASCKSKLLTEGTGGTGLSGSSINRYLAAIGVVMRFACSEWMWLEDNPVARVRREREGRGIVRFLTKKEQQELLHISKDFPCPYIHLVVTLALVTGARRSEIRYLKWQDVNLETGAVTFTKTKNKEVRRVYITGYALELIRKHNKVRTLLNDWVFPHHSPSKNDTPFDFDQNWKLVRKKMKLKNFRFHDLRHTCASNMAMNGASLMDIAEQLGHKTLQMVKRYAHLTESHLKGVMEHVNRDIFPVAHDSSSEKKAG